MNYLVIQQPLYDLIKAGISVEHIQEIPQDLANDNFLDPRMRNVIVPNDLMSAKDLFTEGSHHKNVSVIAINQNL